jgi:catechol 2,3-dioxygenase-like lactoylglutathione lyase family enzyme
VGGAGRLGRAAAAGQGEHQQRPRRLVQRARGRERPELGHGVARRRPVDERAEVLLGQRPSLVRPSLGQGGRRHGRGQLDVAAPQGPGLPQQAGRLLGPPASAQQPGVGPEPGDRGHVGRPARQGVGATAPGERVAVGRQRRAQPRDVGLQGAGGGGRRLVPQQGRQLVEAHGRRRPQRQHGEQLAGLALQGPRGAVGADHLGWAEHPDPHGREPTGTPPQRGHRAATTTGTHGGRMTDTHIVPTPAARPRSLVAGFNHVALVTADLDRLASFYAGLLDAEVVDVPAPPGTRAATIRLTGTGGLVITEVAGNAHVAGSAAMLDRGHLDHLALEAPTAAVLDRLRARLVAAGASDGRVNDYGPMLSVYFTDPDGMGCEVCWVRDPSLAGFHPPGEFTGDLAALGG